MSTAARDNPLRSEASEIRRNALIWMPISALLLGGSVALFPWLTKRFTGPGVLILPALLAVPFLKATLELATGIRFTQLAHAWDDLEGWQRGLLGTGICIGLFALLALVMALGAQFGLFG